MSMKSFVRLPSYVDVSPGHFDEELRVWRVVKKHLGDNHSVITELGRVVMSCDATGEDWMVRWVGEHLSKKIGSGYDERQANVMASVTVERFRKDGRV